MFGIPKMPVTELTPNIDMLKIGILEGELQASEFKTQTEQFMAMNRALSRTIPTEAEVAGRTACCVYENYRPSFDPCCEIIPTDLEIIAEQVNLMNSLNARTSRQSERCCRLNFRR